MDFKRKKRAGGILDAQRVSRTHPKPCIAVQNGDEKMLQKEK